MFAAFTLLAALLPAATIASPMELAARDPVNGPLTGWTLLGCYTDANPASRTLLQTSTVSSTMTPAVCTGFCAGQNFAGTEYTDECYCDYNIEGTATQVSSDSCTMACAGDSSFICGGASLISIYQFTAGVLPQNEATVAGGWTFDACHTDAVGTNGRTLTERITIDAGVTIESCTSACASASYSIAGLEFGQECWCGNSFLVAGTTTALGECSQACNANTLELCGAGNRLSVYVK